MKTNYQIKDLNTGTIVASGTRQDTQDTDQQKIEIIMEHRINNRGNTLTLNGNPVEITLTH
ncbi:MAG: hypothetical protein BWK73_10480 [Thiothrix lacustris]|uniref:Uncharacterized protein n=1 Tax=Thiothrix lacustris TaxID=525917 RepID=A0A1Y1QUI3_9GAMM|nr:MAG: hypothetical protein BWK73_10480 [Thiothrix lacustris]